MKWPDLLTICRHVLLYLCTLGISWLFAGPLPAFLMALLTVAVMMLSIILKKHDPGMRWLAMLLWLFLLLPVFENTGFLSRILPVIYTGTRIAANIDSLSYDQTRSELLIGIALYGIVALFSALENAAAFFAMTLPWFLAWLALATFQLRLLRNPDLSHDVRFLSFSAAISLLFLGLVWALLSPRTAELLKALINFVYARILLRPILWFISAVTWLLQQLARLASFLGFAAADHESGFEAVFEEIGSYNEHYDFFYTQGGDTTWLMILVRILAAALIILISWLLIRRMHRRRTRQEASLSFIKEPSRRRQRHESSEPASRIRLLYRRYLKLADRWQIASDGSQASDRIAERTDALLQSDDASRLRRIWLPVRYGNASDEQAAEAEKLYRRIKKQFREL